MRNSAKLRKRPRFSAFRLAVCTAAGITAAAVLFLVTYILIKGIPHLSPGLFAWVYTSENASLLPALVNTCIIVFLTLLIAAPIGVFSAIWLNEYAKR
ncbi:MAG: phosphate ABC transporter, permease protein PstA, partial [Oscillospiraceae bacterium]|nr:phosphate ABC transporter, permease protein PstA [Oscillospiraceae bacterium]